MATSDTKTPLSLRDLAHLCSVLRSVAVRWVDLGLQVGVAMDDLDVIRSNPLVLHEGIRGFLREMLRQWLQEAKRPTLEDIIEALRQDSLGEERLASGLREEFLKLRAASRKAQAEAEEAVDPEMSQAAKRPRISHSSEDSQHSEKDTCTQLGIEDLIDVSTYLLTLNPDQVFGLGLALGLSVTTLNRIKNPPTFLDDVLTAWLMGKDGVRKRGGHTWDALVNGLRHRRVNQTEIAGRVERERCQQS